MVLLRSKHSFSTPIVKDLNLNNFFLFDTYRSNGDLPSKGLS